MTEFPDGLGLEFQDFSRESQAALRAFSDELARMREEMKETEGEARSLATSISGSLRSAFDRLVFGGGRASDVLRRLGRDLSGSVVSAALRPIQGAVASGIGGILGEALGGLSLFGAGAAFSAGRVRAFASGGVVEGPTLFPMRGGGAGLMGEAGPEAILPLRRGADGRLGVAAAGGGGARVVVNIATPDVGGFRRSRSQVAAQVARAVRLGQRHA